MKRKAAARESRRTSWSKLRLGLAVLMLFGAGCGTDGRPSGLGGEDADGSSDGGSAGPCADGAARACGVTLDQANGSVFCYRGKQYCEAGSWGSCTDGSVSEEPDPTSSEMSGFSRANSLSTAAKCLSNPCDPSCMYFKEDPADITPSGGSVPIDPGIPNWSSSATTTCSHELCTPGTALSASCHPCVQSICATNPTCCTTGWTQTCADLVYTQCAGTVKPTGLNLCDFAGYAQSFIRFGNGGTGSPVLGARGAGTLSTPDGSAVYLETNCRVGPIYAKGAVNLRNGCQISGNVVSEGAAWLEAGSTRLTGTLTSGGNVELRNGTIVTGAIQATGTITLQASAAAQSTLWAGGVITLNNPSNVTGNVQTVGNITGQANGRMFGNATVKSPSTINPILTVDGVKNTAGTVTIPPAPSLVLPDLSAYKRNLTTSCAVAASRPALNVWGPDQTLPPGVYGDVIVYSGFKLILQDGGSYVFSSLRFFAGSQGLRLAGTAKWDVSVCNTFQTDTGIPIYLNGGTTRPNAPDFVVYSAATTGDCISIGDGNLFSGMFLAPECGIRIFNNYTGTAAFWGKSVYSDTGMNLTNIPVASCNATPIFGAAVCDATTQYYTNGRTYANGEVVHYNGVKYTCLVGGWCSAAGGYSGAYWPGRGSAWTSAWSAAGTCPTTANPSTGGVCPIGISAPAVGTARRTCSSGQDCQIDSSCTEVVTSATCAHSKCAAGAALTSSCDSCVARICADTPSCCSTSWTTACAAKVETICDASCGAKTSTACAHDMCAVGSQLAAACSPKVATLCGTAGFAYCCSTTWDQACVNRLFVQETGSPPPVSTNTSICDYAVMGSGSAAIYSTTITGNVGWFSGAVQFAESYSGAGRPRVTGNVYNLGSFALSNTDVTGSVNATGSVSTAGSTFGSLNTPASNIPVVTKPSYSYTCPTGGPDNWSASGTLSPGTYGTVQLGGTLNLQAGTYYMQALNNWSGFTINLPATGNVNIFLCANLQMNGGARILSPSNNPLQLFVYTRGGVINFQDNAVAWGVFTTGQSSGTATSTLGQNVSIRGMVHSYSGVFQSARGSIVNASGATGATCQSRGVDPTIPASPICPVTTPLTDTYASSGTCVVNPSGYKESVTTCAASDLTVGINCLADTVPVCNQGNTSVPANQAELIFYPRNAQQFATNTPDPNWQAGTCTVTSAIPAGACVNQACPASLLNQNMTVRAALRTGASVTECSTLDNWSYYVQGRTCTTSGGSGTAVETNTYQATCPANSYPSWGLLTWNTATPGAANITFEGRVATTSSGLATATYSALKTVTSTPTNNQVCSISTCPLDLTNSFWGAGGKANQPAFMELRITMNGSGASNPTLKDWNVTYSCRYDQ